MDNTHIKLISVLNWEFYLMLEKKNYLQRLLMTLGRVISKGSV